MLAKLFGLATFLPDFLKGLFGWLNKKEDTAVVANNNSKDVSISLVQSETARTQALAGVLKVAMDHPLFWVAWAFGVFPVMTYYAMIFFVSTFPHVWFWLTEIPASAAVLKAPDDALEFAKLVTGSMFGIAGASSVVAGIAHAWQKRA
jgi:hypothetical protein